MRSTYSLSIIKILLLFIISFPFALAVEPCEKNFRVRQGKDLTDQEARFLNDAVCKKVNGEPAIKESQKKGGEDWKYDTGGCVCENGEFLSFNQIAESDGKLKCLSLKDSCYFVGGKFQKSDSPDKQSGCMCEDGNLLNSEDVYIKKKSCIKSCGVCFYQPDKKCEKSIDCKEEECVWSSDYKCISVNEFGCRKWARERNFSLPVKITPDDVLGDDFHIGFFLDKIIKEEPFNGRFCERYYYERFGHGKGPYIVQRIAVCPSLMFGNKVVSFFDRGCKTFSGGYTGEPFLKFLDEIKKSLLPGQQVVYTAYQSNGTYEYNSNGTTFKSFGISKTYLISSNGYAEYPALCDSPETQTTLKKSCTLNDKATCSKYDEITGKPNLINKICCKSLNPFSNSGSWRDGDKC